MDKFITEFEKEQQRQIDRIESLDVCHLKRALEAFQVLGGGIFCMKEFISGYTFRDMNEEIHFFKEIKPRLFSYVIYYRMIYNLEMNRPTGGIDIQREYINRELAQIQKYIDAQLDFLCYFRSGSTYLDEHYFTRKNRDLNSNLETVIFERDPKFSTKCDYKVAKILANDMLMVFLNSELKALDQCHPSLGNVIDTKVGIHLEAQETDIIELLYALYSIGAFGDASLKSVVTFVESAFNVELGNFSRTFIAMKIRDEPTPFLDRLKKSLLERMTRRDKKNTTK